MGKSKQRENIFWFKYPKNKLVLVFNYVIPLFINQENTFWNYRLRKHLKNLTAR